MATSPIISIVFRKPPDDRKNLRKTAFRSRPFGHRGALQPHSSGARGAHREEGRTARCGPTTASGARAFHGRRTCARTRPKPRAFRSPHAAHAAFNPRICAARVHSTNSTITPTSRFPALEVRVRTSETSQHRFRARFSCVSAVFSNPRPTPPNRRALRFCDVPRRP